MGWKGMLIGSALGGLRGGAIGSLLGAFAGHWIEERFFSSWAKRRRRSAFSRESSFDSFSDDLRPAYDLLGAAASDDDETLRRKYRECAKRCHPDILRAEGASEKVVAFATAEMTRINDAWAKIRRARGI